MKIFGVGMNYAAHRKELDETLFGEGQTTDSDRKTTKEPVVFIKADSALLKPGKPFFVPDHLGRIDYEAEIVVRICRLGKNISERFAYRYYDAVTVGIDFTARDLQRKAVANGLPWTISKGFDGSAAIGEWIPVSDDVSEEHSPEGSLLKRAMRNLSFHLTINGQTVQQGCTADMLCSIDELISYLSRFFTLKTGDLIYTGTPVGVGQVHIGDHLEGWLEDRCVLELNCR